jgi:RNA polymerase sigma factor (sigma-70 family)
MPPDRLDTVLRATLAFGRRDQRSDAELLARFVDERDPTAFETLIVRHTPGVRAACRSWLRSSADIDDAAQATFLVLVQRARSIRERAALGGWLYAVATNVARRLRRKGPISLPLPDDVPSSERTEPDDLPEVVAAEVARLPEKYRLPVQLCYLAGLTTAEAADRLGWPRGTVLTRLAWARERLKKSLAGRGVSAALPAVGAATRAVSPEWLALTVRAGQSILAGTSPVLVGVSQRTVSLTEGVVRDMIRDKLKYILVGALLALGGIGFGLHHWANASNGSVVLRTASGEEGEARVAARPPVPAGKEKEAEQTEKEAKKSADIRPGRRREAVIRLPSGTFVKDVEAAPYGSGRVTWTYEEDRVLGLIEASVMGVEVELATEAEYSLSSNGTIYGILTGVKLNHLRLPANEEFKEIQPFVGLWSVVEPVFAEMLLDLPFSYRFRVHNDRLVITNFRMLLAGPNPLGKAGGFLSKDGKDGALLVLAGFQALGTAVEGTYLADDGKERATPARPKTFLKPRGEGMKKLPGFGR